MDQDGEFVVPVGFGSELQSGDDRFWVVDASVGYRLPKRFGIISLEAKNLLDKEFQFQDTDPGNPHILPSRLILFRFTLSF